MPLSATQRSRTIARKSRRLQFQPLESRLPLAAQPIISEFLASNDDSLLDDDGNSTDWIEIFNAGDQSIDLVGHSLTDNPQNVTKWVFPSVTLAANEYLIVFAGDDADPNSGTDLYTGFGLNAGGEYLGLFDPTGTVLSEFENAGADYPEQFEDISYGHSTTETLEPTIAIGAVSQYVVPNATTGPQLADFWRQPSYTLGTYDETWASGSSGFGYETGTGFESFIATDLEPQMHNSHSSLFIRSTFAQDANDPIETLTLRAQYDDGFIAYLNGVELLRANSPTASTSDLSTIPLSNLFDDADGTPLETAILSDTYQVAGDASDLGVFTVIDGGLNTNQLIVPGVTFNLASVGGGSSAVGGKPSNDTFRDISSDAIRTMGISNPPTEKVEDGIGMHADELITFDLDQLRQSAGFAGVDGYFTARTGLNDTAGSPGSVKTVAILSDDSGQVLTGYVNGQRVNVNNSGGVWSFTGTQPDILDGGGPERIAQLALPVPATAAYLTLAATSNGSANSDHAVFSGANLEFNTIALGNLFDDAKGTPLGTALSTRC